MEAPLFCASPSVPIFDLGSWLHRDAERYPLSQKMQADLRMSASAEATRTLSNLGAWASSVAWWRGLTTLEVKWSQRLGLNLGSSECFSWQAQPGGRPPLLFSFKAPVPKAEMRQPPPPPISH